MVTKGFRGVVTTAMLALGVAALWPAAHVRAQLPMPTSTLFEMTGFIQNATLGKEAFAGDPFRGGTITVNNHKVTVPRNTIFQMPATSLTWAELFTLAPSPYGIGSGPNKEDQSGLAVNDTPRPDYTFEVLVQGNRVGDEYVAGLLFISPLSLQMHQGFVSAIDYSTGEVTVGGVRVRLNDPIGRFGRVATHDQRFTIDEDNPTVKSETGYPMCVPRTNPQTADDPLCPQGNRPLVSGKPQMIFTMPARPAPTADETAYPAKRTTPDPWRMAPFQVGDYVTVRGPVVKQRDGGGKIVGQYISAFAVDANVGIFTAPGTLPNYVAIDVLLMGTGPLDDVTLAQEGAKRTIVEGFTTDITAPVVIAPVDVNACTGEGVDRFPWGTQAIDPGPPNGAVAGRWRFRPGAPLFDLKGFPFLPPTREVHVASLFGTVQTMNGLSAGEYTAPNFEFIFPENRGIGTPIVPGNFESMPFLAQGSGERRAFASGKRLGFVGQLDPWPGDAATRPVRSACAPIASAGVTQTVYSGKPFTLDGSASADPNTPSSPLTFSWKQIAGTNALQPTGLDTAAPSFTAPMLTVGAAPMTLTFQLTVSAGTLSGTATVNVIVQAPTDTVPPVVGATTASPTSFKLGTTTPITLSVTATDNSGALNSVVFSFTVNGSTSVGTTAKATQTAGTNTWTVKFTPSTTGTYTFKGVATDNAALSTTSGQAASVAVSR